MERNQFAQIMCNRTKSIAKEAIKLVSAFPQKTEFFVIGKQLIRSASSTAANYRAVVRSRSRKEFYSKLSITIEECDETLFWIELLEESNLLKKESTSRLKEQTTEVLKILARARKSTYNIN